ARLAGRRLGRHRDAGADPDARLVQAARGTTGAAVAPCRMVPTMSRRFVGWGAANAFHGGPLLAWQGHELEGDDGAHAVRSADDTDRAHGGATPASRGDAASWQAGKTRLLASAGAVDDGRRRPRQPRRVGAASARAHDRALAPVVSTG